MDDLLFNEGYLRDSFAEAERRMNAEVEHAPEDHVLHADATAWAAALSARYSIDALELAPAEHWYQDEAVPTQVDVSHDYMRRAIHDPSTPTYIAGYRVVIRIPFTGDPGVLRLQPRTYTLNPPRGTISGHELTTTIEYPHDTPADIGSHARDLANRVETYLRSATADVESFNRELEQKAINAIEARRTMIRRHHEHVAATGLPTRKREDRNTTYVADAIVRRPAPPLPTCALTQPISLEPVLGDEVYEDVLGILRSTASSMERSPGTYDDMGEEDRRQVLPLPLNTQYRGSATAEAFNVAGKTDILLRWEDRNLFIAECKIWRGIKSFTDAVDQLFTYAAWRDTKLAVVMFVGELALSDIVAKGRDALESHEQFDSWGRADNNQKLRATVRWLGDSAHAAQLTVFFVHLPKKASGRIAT